ncbi:alpha/beta hydrolase [Planosporangium sp. 12N6]|uniref:alpha/beta hydrolase n=1 Tax=Planosporangium spinosum TaxID=3402278 RepID=UPI003CF042FD
MRRIVSPAGGPTVRSGWRNLGTALVAIAAATAPAAATLLAPPAVGRLTPPAGVEAWRADGRRLPDPLAADPATVQRFLTAAGPDRQQALAAEYPGVVGNLDGAPPALRYAANQRAMAAAGPPYRGRAGQYLLFDPRGQGMVAQVFGDLSTAGRIAVLVPGAGNRAGNFWRGVGGRAFRSPSVQGSDLFEAARRYGSDADRFAVVVWLGYDAPDGVDISAAREDLARAGAEALVRFVAGLTAIRPRATVALLGYSYGSTVVGLAARRLPGQVTDIAAFGSPGMGVDHASELGTTARVWAGLSRHDLMRWVPGLRLAGLGHGRQPADPDFGATVFGAGDVVDHDHYLAPGTDSQAHLTRIALYGADRQGAA